jgi:hypothetical protein
MALTPYLVVVNLALITVLHTLYLLLDRLVISSLCNIPGPRIAAATGWYECYYDVFKPGQYAFKIKEMHDMYGKQHLNPLFRVATDIQGPIVRISPREVSISDVEFIDTVYAPKNQAKRNKDFEKVKALGINTSIGGAVDHDLHRRRRESLNPFFSKKSVLNLAPEIEEKTAQLEGIFAASIKEKKPINLSDLYFAFSRE